MPELEKQVEDIIDRQNGLEKLLDAIAYVLREKADHIRCNWNDEILAKQYDRSAKMIDNCNSGLTI